MREKHIKYREEYRKARLAGEKPSSFQGANWAFKIWNEFCTFLVEEYSSRRSITLWPI